MNSYQRIALILGVVVFTLVTVNSFVSAQDQKILRGLEGCRVVVAPLEFEIERDGLTTKQLQTDTELKLRMAGIRVFSLKEAARVKGSPYFCLIVDVLKLRQGDYVYTFHVELKEWVLLMRNNDARWATTWHAAGYLGITPNLTSIRQDAKNIVDEFINDYLAVNPK